MGGVPVSRAAAPGILALVVTSILWGTTGTAASFAQGVSPLAIGAASLGIGGLLQGMIALPQLRRQRSELRRRGGLLAAGALAVFVYPLAFYSSMHLGGVALGTVISLGSAPVLSGVLERIFDGHPLRARWWLAVAVGVAGSVLLCLARSAGDQAGQQQVVASVLLGLLAGASYALYSWVVGRLMGSGIERRAAVGSVFSAGGLLLMPVLLLTGAPLLASAVNTWVGLYLSLVPMFLGYVLFGVGLSRVNASTATTITLLEPAVAAVLAVLIVGEHLGVVGWLGVVLIGLALGVLVYSPRRITAQGRPRGPARSSGGQQCPTSRTMQ